MIQQLLGNYPKKMKTLIKKDIFTHMQQFFFYPSQDMKAIKVSFNK